MINLKSSAEIGMMRKSGLVLRDLLLYLEEKIRPGVSTKKLDEFAYDYIKRHGGTPSFLGYGGFPSAHRWTRRWCTASRGTSGLRRA